MSNWVASTRQPVSTSTELDQHLVVHGGPRSKKAKEQQAVAQKAAASILAKHESPVHVTASGVANDDALPDQVHIDVVGVE